MTRIMTVDVEYDYETESSESIPKIVPRILGYFHERKITATFFVLGKIAEKYPLIVKQIAQEHEVASHCYEHIALSSLSHEQQEEQLRRGKEAIEKLGISCIGVRAPYFMASNGHFTRIKKAGFTYDSSISTFFPGRYLHLPRFSPYKKQGITEFPVPNWLGIFPPAGLSYYRFFYPLSRVFPVPYMVYLHPCEFLAAPITKKLPLAVRKIYARYQGEKAWQLFTSFIEKNPCQWVSCREYAEK